MGSEMGGMVLGKKREKMPNFKLGRVIAAVVFFGTGLVGCGGEASSPQTIKDLSSAITNVEQTADGKQITISIKQDSIFQGGNTTKAILEGLIQNFKSLPFENVVVVMNEVLLDQYGRQSVEPIVSLDYPRSEIEKINFSHVVGWNILNISEPKRLGSYSMHIIGQECQDENNAKYAAVFCRAALH